MVNNSDMQKTSIEDPQLRGQEMKVSIAVLCTLHIQDSELGQVMEDMHYITTERGRQDLVYGGRGIICDG